MGWFDSQIKERLRSDRACVDVAMAGLAEALTGSGGAGAAGRATLDAVADILAYFGMHPKQLPNGVTELAEVIDAQLSSRGIMYREVTLTPGWQREAAGAMLGTREDGTPVALLPHGARGYAWLDHAAGKRIVVSGDGLEGLQPRALLFYRPLPQRALGLRDIAVFLLKAVERRDWVLVLVAAAAVALLGLLLPAINSFIFGPLVEGGEVSLVVPVASVLVCITCAQLLITSIKTALVARVHSSVSVALSAALMMRVLSLPTPFFKQYSAGNLAMRIMCVETVADTLQNVVLGSGLTAAFSLVYVGQIATIAPALTAPALIATLASVGVLVAMGWAQMRVMGDLLDWRAKRNGWEYALIGGMQKIRLAGAEGRAFASWADVYRHEIQLTYRGPALVRYGSAIQTAVSLLGTAAIYLTAVSAGVSLAEYMAFNVAYGAVSGALLTLGTVAAQGASVGPYLGMARPVLECAPEVAERGATPARVRGGIELDHVTFTYGEGLPPVLSDLSLKVRAGEYVGIVGRTGCGKSTLMRLLLGFERPQKGAVYYDGQDLATLDVRSLRRSIGVVLQDGKLFQGDIYSNIVVSAPWLTLEDAWRAAEVAGIADDIRAMPMGMQTMVLEGGAGLSGGQRQRIMIARAVAASPRILMFDEATSALDNVTQREVSESLANLHCTRIAIAHRLSTIRQCDRIVVLGEGHVVEQGTYEELMAARGEFYELVRRQQA